MSWEDISSLLEKQREKRQTKYVFLKDEQIRAAVVERNKKKN